MLAADIRNVRGVVLLLGALIAVASIDLTGPEEPGDAEPVQDDDDREV